jgi:hypothetical protein
MRKKARTTRFVIIEEDDYCSSSSISNNNNDDTATSSWFQNLPQNITELAEKKVRLAQAQAKIDSILQSPVDPPFDTEKELSKVISISSSPHLDGGSLLASSSTSSLEDVAHEQNVYQKEEALYQSVKEMDFSKAAEHSSALDQFHLEDGGLVLQANSLFYKAFSYKDIDEMKRLWLADRSCICIHPGHAPLVGAHAIVQSWSRMFESTKGAFQKTWMEPHAIRLSVKAHTAIVTCEEHVYSRRFIRGQTRQTQLEQKLQATNIFRKVSGKWFLTYHHASWHAESEATKRALNGGGQMKKKLNSGNNGGKKQAFGLSSKSSNNSIRKGGDVPPPPMTEFDKILGVPKFGPILGDNASSKSGKDGDEKPVKRVIMGSLSDLLNGNLGGLLGDDDDDDFDDDEDDDDEDDDDELSDGLIQYGIEMEDDDDEDVDDDDDDEDDSVRLDWSRKGREGVRRKTSVNKRNGSNSNNVQSSLKKKEEEERRRQGCILALRKLSSQGRISPKQKRSLLTDIISCSSRGEPSMVEVAYDLLYCDDETIAKLRSEDDDEDGDAGVMVDKDGYGPDDAEDEFADQCIVFAQSLDAGDNLYRR